MKKLISIMLLSALALCVYGCNTNNTMESGEPVYTDETRIGNEDDTEHTTAEPTTENEKVKIEPRSGECGENVTFSLSSDGVLTITGTADGASMQNFKYDENNFTTDSPWDDVRELIVRVVIEGNVEHIGEYSFYNFKKMSSALLPSVQTVGYSAFMNCVSLERAEFTDDLLRLEESAFYGCISLTDINLPDNMQYIGSYAFTGCAFKEFKVPEGIEHIQQATFSWCENLERVELSQSVTEIRYYAFGKCESLKEVVFTPSLRSIGMLSFSSCTGLEQIHIPETVTSIDDGAFSNCDNMTVYGKKDSMAYSFAMRNDVPFAEE